MVESTFSLSRRAVVGTLMAAPLLSIPAFGQASRSRVIVQGRPQDSGSVYKSANIMSACDQLGGVRLMRCRDPYTGTVGWNTYVALARAGMRFSFTLSVRDPDRTIADLRAFLQAAPGSIWAIEYPNEPDLNPVLFNGVQDVRLGFRTGQAPALMAYITAMHGLFADDTQLRDIPIIASNDYMQAEQGPLSNFGNSHIYPQKTSNVATKIAAFRSLVQAGGHGQGVITEWGRTTGGSAANSTAAPVTQAEQAELLASDLTALLAEPMVAAVSLYELFSWPGTGEQDNFGLFNADLSPRPVVAEIRAIIT
jgi:hypothetical protein